jgi:AraC family transcriptional regulator, positive regulator of tynA and feaB
MPVQSWTTDDVPLRQRFDYWSDAICRAVLNVSVVPPLTSAFHGHIATRRTPSVAYVSFASSAHSIVRDGAAAARAGEESYLISLQLGGRAHIRQGNDEVVLQGGGLTLVEGWRPFSVALEGDVRRVLALVPRRVLQSRCPQLRGGKLRVVPAGAPFADLLRDYMLRLSDPQNPVSDSVAEALGENLCNLLGVVGAGDAPAALSNAEVRREALLAFVRRNLADPELSPAAAAAHLGISLRSVHHLLAQSEQSFGALVLEQRLQACARALRDPAQAARRIAEIAYAWGFNDLSHFNRVFKQYHRLTPGEMRAQAAN